jgi:hypothetical protein
MLGAVSVLIAASVFHVAPAGTCQGSIDPRCRMTGDIDGDRRADAVWVKRVDSCHFRLVVRTSTAVLRVPVKPFCGKPSEVWPSGFPRVVALRPMNASPGLEVELLMWAGASNIGLHFFTVRDRRLIEMTIVPRPLRPNEWDDGGFAAAFTLLDCVGPHVVGQFSASYYRQRWTTELAIYRVTGSAFVRVALRVSRRLKDQPNSGRTWPFVRGDGFQHCGGVTR